MKAFRLIVKPGKNSLDILRYVSKNIAGLNRAGIRIKIEKINTSEFTEEVVNSLKKQGVNRLPVLIGPDGKTYVGINAIKRFCDGHLAAPAARPRQAPASWAADFGTNSDLSSFWMNEMCSGTKNGKLIPRTGDDEGVDEGRDLEQRMAEARRQPPPRQRRPQATDFAPDSPPQRRNTYPSGDNIAPEQDFGETAHVPIRAPMLGGGGGGDDAMDQKMLAAWIDNNSGTTD
jgi:hypothetical protein